MRKIFSVVLLAAFCSFSLSAQNEDQEKVDLSFGGDVFSGEPLSYFALSDHSFINVDETFDEYQGRANTEFLMNILELRVRPYESGMFALGIDFDWDYYRLDNSHYWLPDASTGKVEVASMEGTGFKRIKKSRLSVRTLAFPVAFEQSFGKFTLRLGATGEYNFSGICRFKGTDSKGDALKEWKSGTRFADNIKTRTFTYNVFGVLSFEGLGVYLKYSPVQQFEDGYGPQFQTITFGIIAGIGL